MHNAHISHNITVGDWKVQLNMHSLRSELSCKISRSVPKHRKLYIYTDLTIYKIETYEKQQRATPLQSTILAGLFHYI